MTPVLQCRMMMTVAVTVSMQVILGRTHVVSGTGADRLEPSVTADCHTSSVTLSSSHSHATQAIHSQVCLLPVEFMCILFLIESRLTLLWCEERQLLMNFGFHSAPVGVPQYTVSQKTTLTLHTITSMHVNQFW